MNIPKKLSKILARDKNLEGLTKKALADFEKWLGENRMVFFPDYSDHGIKHVERVMQSAEALIRKDAWKHLTPEDSAVSLLSILLHDCAMHLSHQGFLLLISGEEEWKPTSRYFSFAPYDWPQLWDKFIREASRFDEQKLVALFGRPEPVSRPAEDTRDWTDQDKLLIGEFLRRHHGTLAYEIALAGVPGPGRDRLALPKLPDGLADLVGFIAASHVMGLRAATDGLESNGRKLWRNVHAPFLMGVLRIADYLEIDSDRAPEEILRIRSLYSPVSRSEWSKHGAIKDIRPHENDPECQWVDAEPQDVKPFLQLKRLFTDIQAELDATWAVWGEIYGGDPKLRDLGIRIRRLRSTLDDPEEFGKKVPFIPVHAKFDISDADILKLMVGPLYGEHPSYGVRELIQNAVDACLERDDCVSHFPSTIPTDFAQLDADVVVTLEEHENGEGTLTVEDSGIGMTAEVILKYFLTAGASYRRSEQWYQLHAPDNEPRVVRSGRFGIGVLAAFLLGPKIEVTTRHVSQDRGIRFECRLEDREIELLRCDRPVGTTIRAKVSRASMGLLIGFSDALFTDSWDWYTGDHPTVVRRMRLHGRRELWGGTVVEAGETIDVRQCHRLPAAHSDLPTEWRRLEQEDFDDVHWTWGGPDLACNNIKIGESSVGGEVKLAPKFQTGLLNWPSTSVLAPELPSLNVFDRRAKLPINLIRTGFSARLPQPFADRLREAVCRDILAFVLVRAPENGLSCIDSLVQSLANDWLHVNNEGLAHPLTNPEFGRMKQHWLAWTSRGVVMAEPDILGIARPESVWFFPNADVSRIFPSKQLMAAAGAGEYWALLGQLTEGFSFPDQLAFRAIERWIDGVINGAPPATDPTEFICRDLGRTFSSWLNFEVESRAVMVTREFWEETLSEKYLSLDRLELTENLVLFWSGLSPEDWLDLEKLKEVRTNDKSHVVGFWKLGRPKSPQPPLSSLGKMWMEVFRQPLIPFDLKRRRKELAHAYEELAEEIARWEQAGTYRLARQKEEQAITAIPGISLT